MDQDYLALKRYYRSSIRSTKDFIDALRLNSCERVRELSSGVVVFEGLEELATVNCPKHGGFRYPALELLLGFGICRACVREDKFGITDEKLNKPSVVYVLLVEGVTTGERFIKVGVSLCSWRRAHSISQTTNALYKAMPLAELRFETGFQAYEMESRVLELLDDANIPFFPRYSVLKGKSECFQEAAYDLLKQEEIIGGKDHQLVEIDERRTIFSLAKKDTGVGRMEVIQTNRGIWTTYTAGMRNKYDGSTMKGFLSAIENEGKQTKRGTLMNLYLREVYLTALAYFEKK